MFQSTHPHGVRLLTLLQILILLTFQSTHPHGVRLNLLFMFCPSFGFNPRTHTGCDASYPRYFKVFGVSIHAPTRGATAPLNTAAFARMFQSTHPHGVRRDFLTNLILFIMVSIHAPTRGATIFLINAFGFSVFQSSHPHGVRRTEDVSNNVFQEFQSTHPHGVRRSLPAPSSQGYLFQSTPPHGVRRTTGVLF